MRGVAVRQGLRFLRNELPHILAAPCDALSPRMLRVIEDLAGDWRRLDERIEGLSSEIEARARQDKGCERLMTVPGIGRSSRVLWWPRSALEMRSQKAATSAPGLGWYRNKSRPETEQSSAAYRNKAIAICAPCSSRRPGSCWSRSGGVQRARPVVPLAARRTDRARSVRHGLACVRRWQTPPRSHGRCRRSPR